MRLLVFGFNSLSRVMLQQLKHLSLEENKKKKTVVEEEGKHSLKSSHTLFLLVLPVMECSLIKHCLIRLRGNATVMLQ